MPSNSQAPFPSKAWSGSLSVLALVVMIAKRAAERVIRRRASRVTDVRPTWLFLHSDAVVLQQRLQLANISRMMSQPPTNSPLT